MKKFSVVRRTEISIMKCTDRNFCTPKADEKAIVDKFAPIIGEGRFFFLINGLGSICIR